MQDKKTVTANFPGIGPVEISIERAQQIKRLQTIIKKHQKVKDLTSKVKDKEPIYLKQGVTGDDIKAAKVNHEDYFKVLHKALREPERE